jgi:asparagine synthase (glutamine-hydrolysing)
MGIICGIYRRDGKNVDIRVSFSMMQELSNYPLDAKDAWQSDQVFLGNCAQYLTLESYQKKTPCFYSTGNYVITADAVLDNREELFNLLDIKDRKLEDITESDLILRTYQKWGEKCPAYLLGDFAFAIWDAQRKEMFCAVDHTGNRTLYYYIAPHIFAFSTLINPLLCLKEIGRKYSEEWICDFLSIPSVIHQLDCELTLYQDILMLPAAHSLTVSSKGFKKRAYWIVERQKELKFKSDGEYEEALRQVFGQAIKCRLRSCRPVGIMLSGGLDSASITCLASNELKKVNQELYAFTAVPMDGFDSTGLPPARIADETRYIEALKENFSNIIFKYCPFPDKHALSDTERFFTVLEQPYKIFENLFWIDGILREAQKSGVRTMLIGGMGNTTISYGSFYQCGLSLYLSLKWFTLFQEIRAFSKVKHKHPLRVAWVLAKSFVPYEVQKFWQKRRNVNWNRPFELSPVNPVFACQMKRNERFKKFCYDPYYQKKYSAFDHRKMMLSPYHLSHLSTVYTKIALSHNMIIRDPTMDKRVIEFCLSVPVEQFIRQGQERSLIRRAMAGNRLDEPFPCGA